MALSQATTALEADVARGHRPLRVMVVGLRGVVDVQGGIETHARKLYPLLARLGCDVEIVQRSPYYPRQRRRSLWHGIRLTYLWSPTTPVLETGVHSLLGVLYAALKRPDILHLHAIGPGLMAPLARALGLRVVLTHHSIDYQREKWGRVERWLLQAGERFGVTCANRPIAVSSVIGDSVMQRFGIGAHVIPNGAPIVVRASGRAALDRFDLTPRRYVLCVARLESTKRQLDLIAAFRRARMKGWKLVIVGGLEPRCAYTRALEAAVAAEPDIVLTGYQTGTPLRELFTHAGLFAFPSAVEGHPIALLEALSYGLPVVASAIPANLGLPVPRDRFFPVGDLESLVDLLREAAAEIPDARCWRRIRDQVRSSYSWRRAAGATKSVYEAAAQGRGPT